MDGDPAYVNHKMLVIRRLETLRSYAVTGPMLNLIMKGVYVDYEAAYYLKEDGYFIDTLARALGFPG